MNGYGLQTSAMNLDQAVAAAVARDRARAPAALMRSATALSLPDAGQPFTFMNQAAVILPAIAGEVTVVSFTVPNGRAGLIQQIANQFVGGGWTEGTGDLVWRIEIDGVAAQGFNSVLASLGSLSRPADFSGRPIRIREGQVIALILRNVAVPVAAQPVLGLIAGYFFPLSQQMDSTWL